MTDSSKRPVQGGQIGGTSKSVLLPETPISQTSEIPDYLQVDAANGLSSVDNGRLQATEAAQSTRASNEERRYAEYMLTERIRSSTGWMGTSDLLAYLEGQTMWGAYGSSTSRLRSLQNWLVKLRHLADNTGLFDYREPSTNAFEYRGAGHVRLSLEAASLALLAERFLDPFLPGEYLESGLTEHFQTAKARIADHERILGKSGDAVSNLLSRIAITARGQQLSCPTSPYGVIEAVTTAILKRRCLECIYKGRERRLHPYALISRDPKYYVLAVEDVELRENAGAEPKMFLCKRFTDIKVIAAGNLVPEEFEVSGWIAAGGLDIPVAEANRTLQQKTEIQLRIYGVTDNLSIDLKDFPLSENQSLNLDGDTCILHVPGLRVTESLVEWILGRASRVEVLAPVFLREVVAKRLSDTLERYQDRDETRQVQVKHYY